MRSAPIRVSQLTLYNPARMNDAEIVAAYVARGTVFDRIIKEIAAEQPKSRAQHHMIVGPRGMGKSMLLARLATELRASPELATRFVPLAFPEEQYAVDRLSKFWLNCLDALADAAERGQQLCASERIDAAVRALNVEAGGLGGKDETPARAALDAFLYASEDMGKRPVLLVDNLQLVFERISDIEQHALREILMRPGSPILIGASPSPPLASQDYGAAFYDHFKVHYLSPLSVDEMRSLLVALAQRTGRNDVRDRVDSHPERLKTMRELTGGNPRAAAMLFFLYAEDFSPSVFVDLENLLDRVTPFYKARIEELPEQQQVVVSALADYWAPITGRNLAEATGLPPGTVSSLLDRLEKSGFVERLEIVGHASTGFQIAERLFNIWFLMRSASRRRRREAEFLVRFIESFYEPKERSQLAERLRNERDLSIDRFLFAQALGHTLDPNDQAELARHAELDLLRQTDADARKELVQQFDFSRLEPATLEFHELRARIGASVPVGSTVSPETFADEVLGDRRYFVNQVLRLPGMTPSILSEERLATIRGQITRATENDVEKYGATAVDWFRQRLASGQLRSVDDVKDWNRAFLKACEHNVFGIMLDTISPRIGQQLSDEVRSRLRDYLAPKSNDGRAWFYWGDILENKLGWFTEAESSYRIAIRIDPHDSYFWGKLGNLLCLRLDRFEEAEAAYKTALEAAPNNASVWTALGRFLSATSARFAEAEEALRKALAIQPQSYFTWIFLGKFLQDRERFEEAEDAYRKAIEINRRFAPGWERLGNLFRDCLGRFTEAEHAYRKVLEIEPDNFVVWTILGNLFREHPDKFDEAEAAFKIALIHNPIFVPGLYFFGVFSLECRMRFSEAAKVFVRVLEIDASAEAARQKLVSLQRDVFTDIEAAKQTFEPLRHVQEHHAEDSFRLHEAVFAAYDANWGLCRDALSKALEVIGARFPAETVDDWVRASAVLLHLNYGVEMLSFLRECGADVRLRPWVERVSALDRGDRRFLQNIAVEARTTAEYYFDQIDKWLNALPASTSRRPIPKPAKKRQNRRKR